MTYIDTLFDISNRVGGEVKCEYYVLFHKKHNRVICFKDKEKAIEFIKPKFRHSFSKRFLYFLITKGFHKLFFDKIVLSKKLGDVIYIANSVKSFDLEEENVLVFKDNEEDLLNDVSLQVFLSQYKFAAKVLAINQRGLYFKEELLYDEDLSIDDISKRLAQFHNLTEHQYIHGDFVSDHVKVDKDRNIKFIDWNIKQGNITEDIKTFLEKSQ